MKKTDINTLRNASEEELRKREAELRAELQKAYFDQEAGKLNNPHSIKQIRKDIARVMTFLSERRTSSSK